MRILNRRACFIQVFTIDSIFFVYITFIKSRNIKTDELMRKHSFKIVLAIQQHVFPILLKKVNS